MATKRKQYNTCTKQFTLAALRMMEQSDRPTSSITMELAIRRNQLYKWKEPMKKKADVASSTRNLWGRISAVGVK